MKLKPKPFDLISSGKKVIELRLYDEKRRRIKLGDTILFSDTERGKSITARVVELYRFDSFRELYEKIPLQLCGYSAEELATASYRDMEEYYSPEEQERYGVIGIKISLEA